MTLEQQQKFFEIISTKQKEIMLSKGNDYANEDRLSNFKQVASVTNSTPAKVAVNFIAVKVARISNLLEQNKKASNESVEDSVIDLQNYGMLLNMILVEERSDAIAPELSEAYK